MNKAIKRRLGCDKKIIGDAVSVRKKFCIYPVMIVVSLEYKKKKKERLTTKNSCPKTFTEFIGK